jgi:hypothetical protein
MSRILTIATFASLTLALGACAGSNSPSLNAGERIAQRGDTITQYGDSWQSASKDVREGQRIMDKSDGRLADANKQLAKANAAQSEAQASITRAEDDRAKALALINSGTTRMQQAEAAYAAVRAGPAATATPQPR